MSFRIKIPSKTRETSTSSQPSSEAASVKRRTSSKRRFIDSDDEDGDDLSAQAAPVSQRSLPQSKRVKTVEPEDYFVADDNDDEEMMIDIEGDGEPSAADDTSFLPEQYTRSPSPKRSTSDSKPLRKGTSSKKKRHVVYSDDEDDFNVEDDVIPDAGALPFLDDDDEDFEPEPSSRKAASSSKAKGPGKGKAGKHSSSTTKGTKGKMTKEKEKEIVMKDERKLPPPKPESSASSIKRPRPKSPVKDEDEVVDPVAPEVEPSTTTANTPGDTASLAIPKKRKLPTIRKTKPPGSAAGTPTPSQTPAPQKPPVTTTKSTDDIAQITTTSTVPRKPAALLGSADFDLRNASVYAELFNPGGTGPRSGLNRKEKEEERRKELNKMRDEARAKRAEEAKTTFDLQSQADKIARFEDRLRQNGSLALHPNFLAAKFRDDYERERKRQRDKDKESGNTGKEEGEA